MKPFYGDEAPIAAIASAPGKSALALIRCSGTGAIELVSSVFSQSEKLKNAAGNSVIHGWINRNNEKIDEVLVSVFRSPKSYTGEDCLDISCHGGYSTVHILTEILKAAGFRDALPGEFTFRAFMNGKLDLTRSESVMELVSAQTDAGRSRAVKRLSGLLFDEINSIKKILLEALASAEIFLDYSEDEISADTDEKAGMLPGQEQVHKALEKLKKLSATWNRERIYQEGISAVIAGQPNSGKSSLFNLLIKEERSIVTEIPGTTRDWIEAWVSFDGIPVRLADTAGLRESGDPVEKLGVERTRELLDEADLILYLIDGSAGMREADRVFIEYNSRRTDRDAGKRSKPLITIWNKADIAPLPGKLSDNTIISVSAKTGEGIAELSRVITAYVRTDAEEGAEDSLKSAALGSIRQKNRVDAASGALEEALVLAGRGEPLELTARLLREAVNALGEITGEICTADILEEMFSRFCVGK